MTPWTILTCEYPPACGGVADYTAQVAAALVAAGDDVTVFTPPVTGATLSQPGGSAGVDVHVLEDVYGAASRRRIGERLTQRRSTVLVEYVPTAFGLHGANVPFCRWVLERARRHGDDVRVMFHEPYYELTLRPIQQGALALAQRMMAKLLLSAASQVYLSTDAWRAYLAPYAPDGGARFVTLPIPSAIPRNERPAEVGVRRQAFVANDGARLVGHFGTYGTHIAPMLRSVLLTLLDETPDVAAVCIGTGSEAFVRELIAGSPSLDGRVHAAGRVDAGECATILAGCDLLLQPYLDGVTTRRTSVMAGLVNGRPIVTTTGHLTEPVWRETGATALVASGDVTAFVQQTRDLLADDEARRALAVRGQQTYDERFALVHTIAGLRRTREGAAA